MENAFSKNSINPLVPMVILTALFFILGFVTWLNGPLIPFFELACELSQTQAYFVTFAFYIAYFVMAIPSSRVIEKVGYKNGISIGLLVIAAGAFLFYPAAASRTFIVFLFALFIMGTGLALLQTAANPYVVIIGPRESAAARISVLGIANKLAGFIAPLVLTALVLNNMQDFTSEKIALMDNQAKTLALDSLALQLQTPYLYMGILIVVLATLVKIAPLPEINLDEEGAVSHLSTGKQIKNAFAYPQLVLGVITLMLYIAAEVIAGDTIDSLGKQLGVYGSEGNFYLKLTSFTMTAMVVGYILGIILIPRHITQVTALKVSALLGLALSIAIISIDPKIILLYFQQTEIPVVIVLVALLGLANAICWPAIWPLALENLGGYTKIGSALLIMAIIGGAVVPLLYGNWAQRINLENEIQGLTASAKSGNQQAYIILIPCYLMIFFYAFKGHKWRSWS